MFDFIFRHIREHKMRTLAMMLAVIIMVVSVIFSIFLYQNTKSALHYYSYDMVDEYRFTLRSSANILNLFGVENKGVSDETIGRLIADTRIRDVQVFRLVEIPVMAHFSFFSFKFETDVPIFSVTDGALTGATVPIGFSRAMVDFYNAQFAGSSGMFPQLKSDFLIGQNITFTFGASKIFPSLPHIARPIQGTIVSISNDFPGFGIVLPESVVRAKMTETGYELGKPYKVVAYMKQLEDKASIEKDYSKDNPIFDIEGIKEFEHKTESIAIIIGGIVNVVMGVMIVFLLFLLMSYFRERRDVFRMVSVFGLNSQRSYILTLGEPLFIILAAVLIGLIFGYISTFILQAITAKWLTSYGILFPLLLPESYQYLTVGFVILILLTLVVVGLEFQTRKKYIFR